MAKRPIEVTEVFQNILESWVRENISADPDQVRRFFVSNIFQRTLAHVVGRGKNNSIPIEATEAGELKVAATGSGLEDYDYQSHTAASDAAIPYTFASVVSSIDMVVETKAAKVRFSPDGSRWGAWFVLKPGEEYHKDLVITKMEIKNDSAGQNHAARIWGYY